MSDLSVFDNNEKAVDCNGNIDKCVALKRISKGMEYYSFFDILGNENDREIYTHFANEVYQQIFNDYTHIMRQHNHQIQEMQDSLMNDKSLKFKPCILSKCRYTSRHYRADNDEENKENALDPFLNLSKETMDALHFYVFHIFECGLRNIMNQSGDGDEQKDEDQVETAYSDAAFGRLIKRMDETRTKTDHFTRFKVSAKFNIEVDANEEKENKETNGKQPFFDELFRYLLEIGVDDKDIAAFRDILNQDGYDSDSLKYDIKTECNILNKVKNESITKTLIAAEIHSSSFSVGLRFYYWVYYKDIKAIPVKDQWIYNIDNHRGYDICELFVMRKYHSFKDEMVNYPHFCIKQYNDVVLVKVNAFGDTDSVKAIKGSEQTVRGRLHYDIKEGSTLQDDHLCALIMYTDFTDLSAALTRSFRKISVFETLESIKKRNSKYWWWSKKLREAVECFGKDRDHKGFKGPFYTGMRCVMSIPEFNIRLCTPTSTSKHIEVAMQFTGRYGIIIQLNHGNALLRSFDCSWFSRYPEEDERLFVGGWFCIKLESVRIIETKQNFHNFMSALYYLDSMLTGSICIKDLKGNKENKIVIDSLLKWIYLKQNKEEQMDDYIYQTFRGYLQNKKHIVLDLDILDTWAKDKDMVNMIVDSLEEGDERRDAEDKTNLFREYIVQVFKDTESVEIITSDCVGHVQYSISMNGLLCLFEKSAWKKITVKAVERTSVNDSWVSVLWKKEEAALKTECEQRSCNISFKMNITANGYEHHSFVIEKLCL